MFGGLTEEMRQLMVDPTEFDGAAGEECASRPNGAGESPPAGVEVRTLVLEHYQSVYRYAFRLAGTVCDAEDLTQQTFLTAQRKLHQVRDLGKLDKWLFAVLRSCFLKTRRKSRPISAANLELNVDEVPDETVWILEHSGVDEERLQSALNELSDDHKIVLLMYYFEDLSYKEIAARLNVRIGTVMSRLSRAKGWLRKCLLALEETSGASRREATPSPLAVSPPRTPGS